MHKTTPTTPSTSRRRRAAAAGMAAAALGGVLASAVALAPSATAESRPASFAPDIAHFHVTNATDKVGEVTEFKYLQATNGSMGNLGWGTRPALHEKLAPHGPAHDWGMSKSGANAPYAGTVTYKFQDGSYVVIDLDYRVFGGGAHTKCTATGSLTCTTADDTEITIGSI